MDSSDYDPLFFNTILSSVKANPTEKITKKMVGEIQQKIESMNKRSKEKLLLLILQYHAYNENKTENLRKETFPYNGAQSIDEGITFDWKKIPKELKLMVLKFVKIVDN